MRTGLPVPGLPTCICLVLQLPLTLFSLSPLQSEPLPIPGLEETTGADGMDARPELLGGSLAALTPSTAPFQPGMPCLRERV